MIDAATLAAEAKKAKAESADTEKLKQKIRLARKEKMDLVRDAIDLGNELGEVWDQ